MRSIHITAALMLLLVPAVCFAQKPGYGFFTPGVQYAFSPDRATRPSVFQYGLDMGAGLYVDEHVGVHIGFGAFRSARSFSNINRDRRDSFDHGESVCGPKVFAGVDWFVLPEGRICPVVCLSTGYRFLLSAHHDEPLYDREGVKNGLYDKDDVEKGRTDIRYIPIKDYSPWTDNYESVQHGAQGLFLNLRTGVDFKVGGVALRCSLSYEVSQFFDGAFVGDGQERFGYYDTVNGVPSYRPWKVPFADTLRSVIGFSISLVI